MNNLNDVENDVLTEIITDTINRYKTYIENDEDAVIKEHWETEIKILLNIQRKLDL